MERPSYPLIRRTIAALPELYSIAESSPHFGCDLEFSPREEPTIVGLSAGGAKIVVSLTWDEGKEALARLLRSGKTMVGHFILTADLPIIERELGIRVPVSQVEDTVIGHWLLNASLCSMPKRSKPGGGDVEERRGAGYMDLWSVSSFWTEFSQWKACRGENCHGPCPTHDFVGYNGVDTGAVDVAQGRIAAALADRGISRDLVHHSKRLMLVYDRMRRTGVQVNQALIAGLEREADRIKGGLFEVGDVKVTKPCGTCKRVKVSPCKACSTSETPGVRVKVSQGFLAPFNPRSGKSILAYFEAKGVYLGSTSKDDVKKALKRVEKGGKYAEEVHTWLKKLYNYKDAGKGLKSWFDDSYVNALGDAHPRFIVPATSTGRSASSGPNFQNIPKRGFGKEVRRAIIGRSGKILGRADYRQIEFRMVLYASGEDPNIKGDHFTWLVEQAPEIFARAVELNPNHQKARDLAKRDVHASSYLEGLTILYPEDLVSTRTKDTIRAGALKIFRDWEYAGGLVAFTGVNLAQDFFGSASWEHRKAALDLQELHFTRFPSIRKFHREVLAQVERGYVQDRYTGRFLELWGPSGSRSAVEAAKEGAAFFGQGQSATYAQEAILRYDDIGATPLLFVHDELVFERDETFSRDDHKEFMNIMSQESKFYPGFSCPIEASIGPNWLDQEVL